MNVFAGSDEPPDAKAARSDSTDTGRSQSLCNNNMQQNHRSSQDNCEGNENPFLTFWRLGYRRLLPIIPPNAPLNEKSSLAIRMRKNAAHDGRGKTPGILRDGVWQGTDLNKIEATIGDLIIWNDMKAGVGLKTGQGFHLIDADTQVVESARAIEQLIIKRIGKLPVRIGLWPKAGYLIRVRGDFAYCRVEFGERNEKGSLIDRVEILGEGKQFVAHGVHPKTLKPYTWPEDIPNFDDIPIVEPEVLTELLAALSRALPSAKAPIVEGGTGDAPDPKFLRGDPVEVERAVRSMVNTSELFPSRESWRDVGYAIKAALPDNPDLALELFQDWSSKWEDGSDIDENGALIVGNDPDYVAAEYSRMKPPFRRGATWLYEQAELASEGRYKAAQRWFDDPPPEPLFPPEEGTRETRSRRHKLSTLDELLSRPAPTFLIDKFLPEHGLGFLYGRPSTHKTFLALGMALSIGNRLPAWHGHKISARQDAGVVYVAAEGKDGLPTRGLAWRVHHKVQATSERMLILESGLKMLDEKDVVSLIEDIRARVDWPVSLIVIDTLSRVTAGHDENSQQAMSALVANCQRLQTDLGCLVLVVHHAGNDGTMRGSSVLDGAADFILQVSRPKGSPFGTIYAEKFKDSADGWKEGYQVKAVALGERGNSLVTEPSLPVPLAPDPITSRDTAALAALIKAAGHLSKDEAWSQFKAKHGDGRKAGTLRSVKTRSFDALLTSGLISVEADQNGRECVSWVDVDRFCDATGSNDE
ncbi:AAA family ATPase [Bosea sp. (in: a-proteobacteria)]|uniref:AAA family ATPase n=1 Tax=Bosea sp. (in: a-proteobacteria) TaxID=1871050 RepID=UPI002B45DB9A|nr:AAA family ATPase [Bosea sp. (in: a-proteobacteria)]WRH58611.1 MAG: AAA family ATPase [Bosea sp. (in: a-proteobacteria)]